MIKHISLQQYYDSVPPAKPALIPALLHFPTASGTAARGGSIIAIKPINVRFSRGKLTSSVSNLKPGGKASVGRYSWQNPKN